MHRAIYRATGGRLGGRLGTMEQVLLTTTGRRTGRRRTTPLSVLPDGDRLVLVASDGGAPVHPNWYLNLLADPVVVVRRRREVRTMRARPATPAERAVLWPRVVALYRGYGRYQRRTKREIPLVVCEPVRPRSAQHVSGSGLT